MTKAEAIVERARIEKMFGNDTVGLAKQTLYAMLKMKRSDSIGTFQHNVYAVSLGLDTWSLDLEWEVNYVEKVLGDDFVRHVASISLAQIEEDGQTKEFQKFMEKE
jgi:hypothetical protein